MNPFVLAGGGYGDRALLPGKHPQEAFLEIKRALGTGRGAGQLEAWVWASDKPEFLSGFYYFLAV